MLPGTQARRNRQPRKGASKDEDVRVGDPRPVGQALSDQKNLKEVDRHRTILVI